MIDNVIFPVDISLGSKGGPRFSTTILAGQSGSEQRIQNWAQSRGKWNVSHGVKTLDQLQTLQAFFHCRGGMARGFLFYDHRDHSLVGSRIGVGDGVTRSFAVYKVYGDVGGYSVARRITRPAVAGFSVSVGGSVVTGWSLDSAAGVVQFSSAPAAGAVVTVSGSFYVPARFASDEMSVTLDGVVGGWEEILIEEILEG